MNLRQSLALAVPSALIIEAIALPRPMARAGREILGFLGRVWWLLLGGSVVIVIVLVGGAWLLHHRAHVAPLHLHPEAAKWLAEQKPGVPVDGSTLHDRVLQYQERRTKAGVS